jgi:hypothetical protein
MMAMISETEARLNSHEAVCAQRYERITEQFDNGTKRMDKMELLIYAVLIAVLFGPGVAAEFFKKLIGI